MKHISIRVPWHDNFWNGCFCIKPSCNSFCTALPKIAMSKRQDEEDKAQKAWVKMRQEERPACAGENGGFMSPTAYTRTYKHIYAKEGNRHSVLLPTNVEIPPFAALGVPFRYMSRSTQSFLDEQHPEFCKEVAAPFPTSWVYGEKRQKDILSWFRSNVTECESLCVFYCKNGNPVDDNSKRMIVGVGEVAKVHEINEYDSQADFTYPMWELIFEHSIRRDLKQSKGFLIPYQQYLQLDEEYVKKVTGLSKDEALDEIKLTLDKFGNNNHLQDELSYGCDFVSDQSMLMILQAARVSIEAVIRHKLVGGDWQFQLRWINDSVAKVKAMISPFPSFALALKVIGVNYSFLIEQDLRKAGCGSKDNPWIFFEQLLDGKLPIGDTPYAHELPLYRQTWRCQTQDTKNVLQLLSRFEIPGYMIEHYLDRKESYDKLLENPYIICEDFVQQFDHSVTTQMIDTGVFADPEIHGTCVPQSPSLVETVIDERRLRSLIIERLCYALNDGDTLMSISEMEDYLRQTLKNLNNASLPIDIISTLKPFFSTEIAYIPEDNSKALQLKEYFQMEDKLRRVLLKRAAKGVKRPVSEDWSSITKSDNNYNPNSERSVRATEKQTEALMMMASKRLSVLTGGAGTGKTTVVRSFLSSDEILREGVLLLAPTGKARVRLGNMAQRKGIKAKTVAQFLVRQQRFNHDLMMPQVNENASKYADAKNVIIDECSMLTTRDLFVLFDALDMAKINRIILIGDPYQLPPIGAGRPFSDLCHHLLKDSQDDNLKSAITSLETVVRTIATGESDVLTLASWFGGNKPQKNADEVFDKIEGNRLENDLKVFYWDTEEDLVSQLQGALCCEFNCSEAEVGLQLKSKMGMDCISLLYSNPELLENFQILSPVLNPVWGTYHINEVIQDWIGNKENPYEKMQFGSQNIFALDKVIQLRNEKKKGFPSEIEYQLSNGQIGFVKNICKKGNLSKFCNITFAGIPNNTIGYTSVGEEADIPFELAYAITIHKSQGSDFDTVLIVLPKSGRILSRELIYTALTRAKHKVILLVQENINWLRELSKPQSSVLARRNSNLFEYSVREQKNYIPYVEGLIHSTKPDSSGNVLFVRSKSEVIIANELISAGIKFSYEKQIEDGGHRCIPDFSFETDDGDTIIWEHLGMLGLAEYSNSWERKLAFYKQMGFVEGETLFTTEDHRNGSIATTEIMKVIETIKGIME